MASTSWESPESGSSSKILLDTSTAAIYCSGETAGGSWYDFQMVFTSNNSNILLEGSTTYTANIGRNADFAFDVYAVADIAPSTALVTIQLQGDQGSGWETIETRTVYIYGCLNPTYTLGTLTTNLTYTGSAIQVLTAPGSCSDGTLYYGLSTDSSTAPSNWYATQNYANMTVTNIGTYYVWYKITGDSTHVNINRRQWSSIIIKLACPFSVNVSGEWKQCTAAYVNVNGTWIEAETKVNVGGTWQ